MVEALLLLAVLSLSRMLLSEYRENQRLTSNLHLLDERLHHYRTRLDEEVASVGVLRLRCAEFEALRASDAAEIRALGLKIHRLESTAHTMARTEVAIQTPLRDSLVSLCDTVQLFHWQDPWVEVSGSLRGDSLSCRVQSVDTLIQVVHRIPHRFLFFRWGTKALRQEIRSKNPHTRIVAAEYVQIEK